MLTDDVDTTTARERQRAGAAPRHEEAHFGTYAHAKMVKTAKTPRRGRA